MALAVSVLAHLLVMAGVPWSSSPALDVSLPIEARLMAAPAAVAEIPSPPPSPPTRRPQVPVIAEPVPPEQARGADSEQEASHSAVREDEMADALGDDATAAEETAVEVAIAEPPAADEPQAVSMPALRALPARLVLHYAVQTGEGGFTLGRSTITWTFNDGRYVLESVTQASGVTALLVSGRIAQHSAGRVSEAGLLPERFAMERGKRDPQRAAFDWAGERLRLRDGEVELPVGTQDMLGFPFHLAMVLRGDEAPWRMAVTDGRKLRDYDFRVVERAPPPRAQRFADAVHLQGSRAGDGSLDVWLAPSLHWLPVRIRTLDDKGRAMVLSLEAEDLE